MEFSLPVDLQVVEVRTAFERLTLYRFPVATAALQETVGFP
jgi:hypothetical protein